MSLLTQQQFETGKTPLPNIPKSPESGIGDDAYFAKTPGLGYILSVKKGATYFRVEARPILGFTHKKGSGVEEKTLDEKSTGGSYRELLGMVPALGLQRQGCEAPRYPGADGWPGSA